MVRTQIQLTKEQAEALKRLAAEEQVSVAEVIRRSIDATMGATARPSSQERWRRALAAIGRYRSADSDVSVNHDDYLAEAYQVMTIFADTSAFYAVLDAQDTNHVRAGNVMSDLAAHDADLVCTNYVLLESAALVQRRLGVAAVRTLHEDLVPLLRIEWISAEEHQAAVEAVLAANRRELSLVDCTSFAAMRRLGIRQVFAFDGHFAEQGFECLPKSTARGDM